MRRRSLWILFVVMWLAGTLLVTWIGFLYEAQWLGWILAIAWGLTIGRDFGPALRPQRP